MGQTELFNIKPTPKVETPLMKQYYEIKNRYPDALLLFRVGDFYETFGEDAVKASGILGIVLNWLGFRTIHWTIICQNLFERASGLLFVTNWRIPN